MVTPTLFDSSSLRYSLVDTAVSRPVPPEMRDEPAKNRGMVMPPLGTTKRAIVDRLKRVGAATVPELAESLELTAAGVRQHVDALAVNGLVEARTRVPKG